MGSFYDRVFAEVQVRASTLGQQAGGILLNLLGFAADPTDTDAEVSAGEPAWGTPGMYCRPRDGDATGCAEYIAARGVDGLRPMAGRDLRITKARSTAGNVANGTVGLAGYGGAYVEITYDATSGKDRVTLTNGPLSLVLDGPTGKTTLADGGAALGIDASGNITAKTGNAELAATALAAGLLWDNGAGTSAAVNATPVGIALSYTTGASTCSITLGPGGTVAIIAPGGLTVNGVPVP